ncbi:hypothetical protein WJX84_005066 [Apatococcus fuscideae]|uniref:Uncharacterized protein n=1 Tax=Apatococcus fuscideae TaxID=2026836 RepID=A0AAW1T1G0_9CHLO
MKRGPTNLELPTDIPPKRARVEALKMFPEPIKDPMDVSPRRPPRRGCAPHAKRAWERLSKQCGDLIQHSGGLSTLLKRLNKPSVPSFFQLPTRLNLGPDPAYNPRSIAVGNSKPLLSAVSFPGAFYSEQYILQVKWRDFWNLRQLKPAWSSSSEAIQFSICIEKSKVVWVDPMFKGCHGQPTKKMKRPDKYMDCVLELTMPPAGLEKNSELVDDLEACASQDFGASCKTWYSVRKALVTKWPYMRLLHEMNRQRAAAGVCLECRQKLHILCVRGRCRDCCQSRQFSEDCKCHSRAAKDVRQQQLSKSKGRKRAAKQEFLAQQTGEAASRLPGTHSSE